MSQSPPFSFRAAIVICLMAAALVMKASSCAVATEERAYDAAVRIANRQGDGTSLGSGTFIKGDRRVGVVITCAHLFSDGVGEVYVLPPQGKSQAALVVAIDDENDLACLITSQRAGVTVPIAEELPSVGSALASCGFGQEGIFHVNHGEHLNYATLKGGEFEGVLEIAGSARQGDSGGPIFSAAGELVAVIMGTDGDTVDGTHCRRIRAFLAEHPVTDAMVAEAARLASRANDERAASFVATLDGRTEETFARAATVSLSGRVIFDRVGVSGARVQLSGRAIREVQLDDNGHFRFDGLPAGRYQVDVEKIVKNKFREAKRSVVVSSARPNVEIELQLE